MNGYKFTILPIARGKNRNISFVEKDVFMAGAYYHQDAFKRFCAEADDGGFIAEYELNNPHDENAIVLKNLCGETLGYVPREIAFSISLRSDKNSLYIRPRYKKWTPDNNVFIFDIVKVDDPASLSQDELFLYVKIDEKKCVGTIDRENNFEKKKKFKCGECGKTFDQPKRKILSSRLLNIVMFIVSCVLLCIPILGALLLGITLCMWAMRKMSILKKYGCPYCGSSNYVKNF